MRANPAEDGAASLQADSAERESGIAAAIWRALGSVVDPELPFISVVELGVVRAVERDADGWQVAITPTYSGCPATRVIEADIVAALSAAGYGRIRVITRLAPPWTSDAIAPEARRRLREAGIVAPAPQASVTAIGIRMQPDRSAPGAPVACPRCGSTRTLEVSRFGSTACKAQYRCTDCLEPFDYFKPH
jgi:ring-1,2-phenylacetyl-CoA epoxidase subunit PaaD